MRVVRYRNNDEGQRTTEIIDAFTVPFPVVEVRFSDRCEMEFVAADGTVVSSVDIGDAA